MTCFVYFVQAGSVDEGAIKIGYSADVEKRIESLRTGNHLPLTLLAKFDLGTNEAAAAFEKAMHAAFIDLRLEGEWFALDARIIEIIGVLKMLDERALQTIKTTGAPPSWFMSRMRSSNAEVIAVGPSHDPLVKDWHVVEWSFSQSCLRVDSLGDHVKIAFLQHVLGHGEPNDYAIVAIAPTYEAAHALADVLEPTLRAMRVARNAGAQAAFEARERGRKGDR